MLSLGPSSKVRAMAGRTGLPRQREGPKTAEERPRTAQARTDPAARAPALPMGKGSMKAYCSEEDEGKWHGRQESGLATHRQAGLADARASTWTYRLYSNSPSWSAVSWQSRMIL